MAPRPILPLALATLLLGGACDPKAEERSDNRGRVTSGSKQRADVPGEAQGLRLSLPGPEWKVLAGEDAAALCDGAVLAAMSPTATGTVHLRPLEGSLGDHLTALAEGLHLAESAITLGAPETDGAGRPRQVVTLTGKLGDTPLQVTGRAVVQDAVVVEALAWAPSDTPGEALTAFLDALEVTSPPGALPPASPSRQDVGVGEDQSLRKGRYRDFALALELSVPEGWEASLGPAAERLHELARLHLHHAEHQLHLVLLGEPAASDWNTASHHEAVRAGMQARVGLSAASAESRKIGDVDALVSEGQAGARSYRVYTALHNEMGLQLVAWTTKGGLEPHREALDGLAAGFALPPALAAVEATTSTFADHRLGYGMSLPTGWRRSDATSETLAHRGTFVRWEKDGRLIAVLGLAPRGPEPRRRWTLMLLEQLLREAMVDRTRGLPVVSQTKLADRPAVRVSWHAPMQQVNATLLEEEGVVYAVVTADHGGEAESLAERGFSLLP